MQWLVTEAGEPSSESDPDVPTPRVEPNRLDSLPPGRHDALVSPPASPDPERHRFAAALVELETELDWTALGRLYCHEDGDDFFDEARRAEIREAGLHFAADVSEALFALEGPDAGRSLYVGAALAELAPMLCEALVLRREVVARSLAGPEASELNRALTVTEERLGFPLPRIGSTPLDELEGPFDHGWLVSVLNDPEAFPALHDELYERSGGALATNRGDLDREREAARALALALVERVRRPGLFTTTDEELPLVREVCATRGLRLLGSGATRLSGTVGDPVRICHLVQA